MLGSCPLEPISVILFLYPTSSSLFRFRPPLPLQALTCQLYGKTCSGYKAIFRPLLRRFPTPSFGDCVWTSQKKPGFYGWTSQRSSHIVDAFWLLILTRTLGHLSVVLSIYLGPATGTQGHTGSSPYCTSVLLRTKLDCYCIRMTDVGLVLKMLPA